MMATEAPQERPSEASVTSDEPTIKIDADPQHADSDHPQVNGDAAGPSTDEIENKQIADIVDDLVNSAEVSISGGSDTETSRSNKLHPDDKGHGRTSSAVKKPASFKAVSVNKTFLAAKGASTNAPSKANDKPGAASGTSSPGVASLSARPRLVAKSGSGLVAKSSTGVNGATGTAPDPSAVWNKNRPVPPPAPKDYTDEELKKYGIHMASRLQSDDNKGQANWADIDDDDDDWAPESITWKDGTKITIPHTEEHAATPVAAPSPTPATATTTTSTPAAPAPVQQMTVTPVEKPKSPAPILLTAKPPTLPSGKGIVFSKAAPEKPTLVAKPPAPPTPVKSPWASIPRVDNAAPVVVAPPTSLQGPARFGLRDDGVSHGTTPPPPKEIAADDFSRSPYGAGPGAHNRELFNSHSGRYEPVPDRRGSVRTDQHSRPAALLQRASQHDTQGPAEPSAAFQTSRVSETHNPYGRRRGSSIVSGGSGSYMHLKGPHDHPLAPPEVLSARRESFTAVTDGPRSPVRNFSPTAQHHTQQPPGNQQQHWQPHVSPASLHSLPHAQPAAAAVSPVPQPAGMSMEDEIALQKRLMHEKRELAKKRRQEEEAREEAERRERIRLKLEALGPAPESRSAKKAATKEESPVEPQATAREVTAPQIIQKHPAPETKVTEAPSAPASAKPESKAETTSVEAVPEQAQPPRMPTQDEVHVRPQQQGPPNVGWPTGPRQSQQFSHRTVWGSPYDNTRSLGNGAFIPELAAKPVPGPIAPPSTARIPSGPAARPAPIGPPGQVPRRPIGAQPRNPAPAANAWAAVIQANDLATAQKLRAAQEEQEQKLQAEGLEIAAVQAPIKDTWRPTKVDDDGRRKNEAKLQQAYHAAKTPSWLQSADSANQPTLASTQGQGTVASQASSDYAAGATADMSSTSILGTAMQQTRSSRFFPSTSSRDIRQEAPAGTDNLGRSSSPSPPPPDMAGHPAFDGDVAHPHVLLPPAKPVVRLPPAQVAPAPIAPPQPGQGPSFGWAAPEPYKGPDGSAASSAGPQNNNNNNNWQARIDSLLGVNPSSHVKTVPVDSASRRSLEHPQSAQNATVSLPRGLFRTWPSDSDDSPTTKDQAESCFEEQEMGSLPPVRMPKLAPEAAWHPSAPTKPLPKRFWPSVSTAEDLRFATDYTGNGAVITIFAPGMGDRKMVTLPPSRNRSNPRRGGRGSRHSSQQQRGGKGREPSASYEQVPAPSSGPSGLSGPSGNNRGGRGGYPRRDWSRHNGPAAIPI